MDWASIMAGARKVVHDTFKVPVQYEDPRAIGVLVPLHVRWHDRLTLTGNVVDTGYADVLEGIDRIIFEREQLVALGVTLQRRGKVHFGPTYQNIVLNLETLELTEGPVNVVWKVTR